MFSKKENGLIAYSLLALLAAILPWLTAWVPTQDGPQHLRLTAFLIEMRHDPHSPLHAVYQDMLDLNTSSIFAWFCYLLHPLCRIETAERLWISLCTLGFAWVGWSWTKKIHPESTKRALILSPFFVNWFTTIGFFPYLASVPLGATAGYLLLSDSPSHPSSWKGWGRTLVAGFLLFLCYLGHISTLLLVIAATSFLTFWKKDFRKTRWIQLLLACLPSLFLAIRSLRVLEIGVSTHQTPMSDRIQWAGPPEALYQFFQSGWANVGPWDRSAQTIALVILFILFVIAIFQFSERGWKSIKENWPLAFSLLLFTAFFLLPTRLLGWSYASARMIPFIFLLLPSAIFWPTTGSCSEKQLVRGISGIALITLVSIGIEWAQVGRELDQVAQSASSIRPGSRLLPLVFKPGADAPIAARRFGQGLHTWAIASRLSHSMVPFGFENMRRLMLSARSDANPPFPSGPDEFAAMTLWNSSPNIPPRVYAEYPLHMTDITDAARFMISEITDPVFYSKLQITLLQQAEKNFHYLLAIYPPPLFLSQADSLGWPCLFSKNGVYLYRLKMDLEKNVLGFAGK